MNTRLQVEHPVTELVTGLDLVEWQIRIASGEALDFSQDEVQRNGHAIEVRINAEDPSGGRFSPSPGTLTTFHPPAGPGVRLDAGYETGDTVSQYYDNLIAKLIVWAPDREAARRRMLRAISETSISGVATTLPAHEAILTHPDFAAAIHSTKWVEEVLDLSGLVAAPGAAPVPAPGADEVPTVERDVTAEVDGRRYSLRLWVPDLGMVAASGRVAARPKRAAGSSVAGAGSGQVAVPMQGTIVKVLVAVGDVVEVGQAICLLEAMKMEDAVNAEKDGVVKEVRVSAGDSVGAAAAAVDRHLDQLVSLSHFVHSNPELCFDETVSSRAVAEALRAGGLQVHEGVYELPTALETRAGGGELEVAVCAEYDALPEVGHACGHNIIAAASVGAGLALAAVAEGVGLRVRVLGTPAEEGGGGKVLMLERGAFDGVHAAMMVHPWPSERLTATCLAVAHFDVRYTGQEAHASASPWEGVNAQDALTVAQVAIGLLRQQLPPGDQVHGVVRESPGAANVIPGAVRARYMVRSGTAEGLAALL